jgi:hypothetical protein
MSAFIVPSTTINQVLRHLPLINPSSDAARDLVWHLRSDDSVQELGQSMMDLNIKAVTSRYGEGRLEQFRAAAYRYVAGEPASVIQAYKSLQCWLYQCTEGDVPETDFYKTMQRVHAEMAHAIVQGMHAYELASWVAETEPETVQS